MYDLHAHILPGVDDGAATREDAVEMARVAAEHGTKVILATPHRRDITDNHSVPYIQDLLAQLNLDLEKAGVELKLLLGMENHLDLELPEDLSKGRALTINGSRYALVELPFFGYPNYVEDVLFQIQVQGVTPVLAHPERIEAIQRKPDLLVGFVERGMLSQITAGSVVGHFGGNVRRTTRSLLKRGLVHIIASDTHFPRGPRSPVLPPGMEAAASIVGYERARAMVVDTPRAILDDVAVEVELPSRDEVQRRWWRPWTT
jgi:protein-tyrosine phosphatase